VSAVVGEKPSTAPEASIFFTVTVTPLARPTYPVPLMMTRTSFNLERSTMILTWFGAAYVTVNLLQPNLGSKGMLTAPRMRISQFAFLHAFTSEPFRARSTGGAGSSARC
jgi:hypothetical protein